MTAREDRRAERERVRDLLALDKRLGTLQHFELLGVTPLEIENGAEGLGHLRTAMRALATEYHPDRWATAPEEHRVASARIMSAVNVAYDALREPRTRTQYVATLASTHYACFTCAGNGAVWMPRRAGWKGVTTGQELRICTSCDGAGWKLKDEPRKKP